MRIIRADKKYLLWLLAAAALILALMPLPVHAGAFRWTVTSYPDASGNQGMFYTIYNDSTGELIVVDGGWSENVPQVRAAIAACGNEVDAWILTHYHNDHVDAFNAIYEDPQGIRIRRIYASPMDEKLYQKVAKSWDYPEYYQKFLSLTKNDDRLVYVQRDDSFKMSGLSVTFYNTYDNTLLDVVGKSDLPNNGSLVFKMSGEEESFLFLGDAHDRQLGNYLLKTYRDELDATYVQAGHHGNNSMPEVFYQELAPKYMVFDAPEWLMTGDNYTAKKLAAWCAERGIQTFDFRTGPNSFIIK